MGGRVCAGGPRLTQPGVAASPPRSIQEEAVRARTASGGASGADGRTQVLRRTLVLSDVHKKSARFEWENDILETLPLPSTLVRQILINLLLNAIAAVEVQGRVRCHIYRNSASMIVRVENGGQHIPPERMAYLFEPFSSGHEGGHGLGLWVIYQITQQMKGEIMVQSQPGQTCFVVTLPIKEQVS